MPAISLDYVRTYRRMPWIKRGIRVVVDGREGRVAGGNSQGNINVKFPGQSWSANCHPQWETTYFDKDGQILADYRNTTEGK